MEEPHDRRKVLDREASLDASVVSAQPYAASIYDHISPRSILAQTGHHERCPLGIRDCNVRLAGRWLQNDMVYDIQNGALRGLFIAQYPEYVCAAERHKLERQNQCFRLRDSPLGFRDLIVDYPDLMAVQ